MQYSQEVEHVPLLPKGAYHGPAPIPEEGKWVQAKEISDISGLTHGVGWCAPQQGACKLTLNVKDGIIEEALVETIGCSGMTHSAAMASEILPGKTILEALNTDLVCVTPSTLLCAGIFLRIVYGRSQTARSPRAACPWAPPSTTSARAFALRSAPCSAPRPRALATSSSLRATSPAWLSTTRTRSSHSSS